MSAALAARWCPPAIFSILPWPRFVEAVRRHDDGWAFEEDCPALEPGGRPYDFKDLPVTLHVEIWRRSVDLAGREDPIQGLVVAQHGRWLCTQNPTKSTRADQEAADGFVADMTRRIESEVERIAPDAPQEARDPRTWEATRRLLTFFDALSLMLLGAVPFSGETELLPFGGEEARLSLRPDGGRLRVGPWPFTDRAVTLEACGWRTDRTHFGSPDELIRAMARAPRIQFLWELRGD
jgi:hypothetical protein